MGSSIKVKKHQITHYWEPIMKKKGVDIMWDYGGQKEIASNVVYYCFACGCPDSVMGGLQRTHIKSRTQGGKDEPSNLHLLCTKCHVESEYLSGRAYWNWLRYVYENECNPDPHDKLYKKAGIDKIKLTEQLIERRNIKREDLNDDKLKFYASVVQRYTSMLLDGRFGWDKDIDDD